MGIQPSNLHGVAIASNVPGFPCLPGRSERCQSKRRCPNGGSVGHSGRDSGVERGTGDAPERLRQVAALLPTPLAC
jgi:hypothetical protein